MEDKVDQMNFDFTPVSIHKDGSNPSYWTCLKGQLLLTVFPPYPNANLLAITLVCLTHWSCNLTDNRSGERLAFSLGLEDKQAAMAEAVRLQDNFLAKSHTEYVDSMKREDNYIPEPPENLGGEEPETEMEEQ